MARNKRNTGRLWILPALCVWLSLCLYGCGRKAPEIPKLETGDDVFGKVFSGRSYATITADNIDYNWSMLCAWAGGLCVIVGVLFILWTKRQDIGIRLVITGFALSLTARAMIWYGENTTLVWVILGIGFILYCAMRPTWAEKMLAKVHIYVDLNNDGMLGTGRTARKIGKKIWWIFHRRHQENDSEAVSHDEIPTDRIE